ncbi:MAG: AGE family epimerase/isomerase [Candidatus Magnetoovum sp. WYHC-5]|nr:AGE family epimerase/isomerase [Candidatus Magnetoovum sp. WYHC-5]
MSFEFTDTIAGYVTNFDFSTNVFTMKTSDNREFQIKIAANTYAELTRNLGESFIDCTGQMKDMLAPGRFLFVYGVFYPEANKPFEAEHIIFAGRSESEYVFEKKDWWIKQIQQLGNFYLKAQFEGEDIDYVNYRTMLDLYGHKVDSSRQETDTISRLVYGFASAYNLTGDDRFLEAAEKGTAYLRNHFRAVDDGENICYWYHAIDFSDKGGRRILGSNMPDIPGMRRGSLKTVRERKLFASEFGDDYEALPAYEQIYALAGPTQTYRVNGDPTIRKDIDRTLNFFDRYYKDHVKGGYYSHLDPVTFSGTSESLGRNRARKNWNSVGDHAPAYLINLYLATGEKAHLDMLTDTADTIADHFPDYNDSAFVQEKFHEDWTKDQTWGWQQNRGVVGHNLKIAWNLMRIYHAKQDEKYVALAKKIAELMPEHGMDRQRGGCYDVVDRTLGEGEKVHRFAWHDRKAWWQQEQGILAYLILHGSLKNADYLKFAREMSAFYNAWFLDHDSGAVYFNVLSSGIPYLLGTERMKGSHSMSGYHSFELCFLAAVYTNLMITKQPMDFYFKPYPNGFKDNVLRVAPDILPAGSIKIESVTINGESYSNFDAAGLTVKLPDTNERVTVKVTIAPTSGVEHVNISADMDGDVAKIVLAGELDARAIAPLRKALDNVMQAKRVVIVMNDLKYMASEGARALIFAKQKMKIEEDVFIVGASGQPKELLEKDEFTEEVTMSSSYEAAKEGRA